MPHLHVNATPQTNTIDIDYEEVPSSPQEGSTKDQYQSQRTFILPWSQRWRFCAGMMGWSYVRSSGSVYKGPGRDFTGQFRGIDMSWNIARIQPVGYAPLDFDDTKWLYPVGILGMEGIGKITGYDSNSVAQYLKVKISLGYSTLTYKILGDGINANENDVSILDEQGNSTIYADESQLYRYVTIFRSPQCEYVAVPFGGFSWSQPRNPDGTLPKVSESLGQIVPATEIIVIWHQVPTLPIGLEYMLGSVNGFALRLKRLIPNPDFPGQLDLTNTGAIGTLLLTSMDIKPYRWFFNQKMYDITYRFKSFDQQMFPFTARDSNNELLNNIFHTGHNLYLRSFAGDSGKAPAYWLITNDGAQPPEPSLTLPIGKVDIMRPDTGYTIYPYANHRALFFPSAPSQPPE